MCQLGKSRSPGVWAVSKSVGNKRISSDEMGRRRPDFMVILVALFGLGVVLTLLLPLASNDTVAAPASELHAGIFIDN